MPDFFSTYGAYILIVVLSFTVHFSIALYARSQRIRAEKAEVQARKYAARAEKARMMVDLDKRWNDDRLNSDSHDRLLRHLSRRTHIRGTNKSEES